MDMAISPYFGANGP